MLFSGPSVPSSQQETKDDDGQPHVAEAPEQYRSDKKQGADPEKSKSEKELVCSPDQADTNVSTPIKNIIIKTITNISLPPSEKFNSQPKTDLY